jgi:hypothetical protein
MATQPLGSVIAAGQVQQYVSNLGCRKVVEVPRRLGLDGLQGAVQLGNRRSEHVVGLFPTMNLGKTPQHFPRQPPQPLAGVLDEPLPRGLIACPHEVEQSNELRGVTGRFRHRGEDAW